MNELIRRIIETKQVTTSSGLTVDLHSHVPPGEGEFLHSLVSQCRPVASLEIGLAYGLSALFICDALASVSPSATHIAIDPAQNGHWQGVGLELLERSGHRGRVEFVAEPSHRALPRLEAEGRRIDFAFIDGWHTFDYVLVDFFYVDKLLNVGGVVALDDANWPAVRQVCRFVATNLAYEVAGVWPAASSARTEIQRRCLEMAYRVPPSQARADGLGGDETAPTDARFGLTGRCIAFRKLAEDARSWSHHTPF